MSKKLKVGVVGTGGMFYGGHLAAWEACPDAQLVALCDIVPEKMTRAGDAMKIERRFTDYRELIVLKDVDAVDIVTPNILHSEVAVAALEAGKHVFCEKPDAVSVAEARKMADAAARSGRTLMVMRNNRFTEGARFLKSAIRAGQFGDIYTGRCGWIRRRGIPGKGGWFTTRELSGGGPLIDLGVHMIDLAMYLMGSPSPVSVSGMTYRKFADTDASDSVHSGFGERKADGIFDVEDLATGFIRFANGATLQIEFSWASNIEQEMNFVELRGSKAGATWRGGEVKMFTEIAGTLCDVSPRLPKAPYNAHIQNILHFVDVVLGRAQPVNSPAEGVDMIKILCAIYESAASGREVRL